MTLEQLYRDYYNMNFRFKSKNGKLYTFVE